MPDDLDPDEIVARNKEEWKQLIENAKPIVTHVMESLAVGQNVNDAKVKNQIAAQVLPLIEDLPSPMERDTYRQALARMLRVDERVLTGTLAPGTAVRRKPRITGQAPKAESTPKVISPVSPIFKIEEYCLGVLFRTPEMLYRLDRKLEEFGLSPLAAEDFGYTDHQLLFGVVRQSIEQDEKDHHHFALTHLPETLEGLSKELLAQTDKPDPVEDRVLEDLVNRFIDLRRMVAQSNVSQLRFLQEDEQQNGALNLKMYQEQTLQFTRLLQSLDQAKRKLALKRQA
jgi:DNA primase